MNFPVEFGAEFLENYRKMRKRDLRPKKVNKALDNFFEKRGRGRPGVRPAEIAGRAGNYRLILDQVWDRLWPSLSKAKTQEEVNRAFQEGTNPYERELVPALTLVLPVLRDKKFPKGRKTRINFIADSLAGLGRVSPRRSRDICEQERGRQKRSHHIISYEYWITCSCGYKGRSEDHGCPKCGAQISLHVADTPFNFL